MHQHKIFWYHEQLISHFVVRLLGTVCNCEANIESCKYFLALHKCELALTCTHNYALETSIAKNV